MCVSCMLSWGTLCKGNNSEKDEAFLLLFFFPGYTVICYWIVWALDVIYFQVHNWTVEQTSEWLATNVELPQYIPNFIQHRVTGATLPRLLVIFHLLKVFWALNAVCFAFEVKAKLGQGKNEHRVAPTCLPSSHLPTACLPTFTSCHFLCLCILGSLLELRKWRCVI